MAGLTAFELEVAHLMVENLNLSVSPEDVEPNKPLFENGLGLDSIDALELSLAISQRYGLEIRSDDKNIKQLFSKKLFNIFWGGRIKQLLFVEFWINAFFSEVGLSCREVGLCCRCVPYTNLFAIIEK